MSAFPALAVANSILDAAEAQGKPLTIMQLLKLVYISHGFSLGLFDVPLVSEAPLAWQHGPVYPSVYREFRRFGAQPITGRAKHPFMGDYSAELSEDQRQIVASVVKNYGSMHAFRLSAITHQTGTPWSVTFKNGEGRDGEIPDGLIRDHYKRLIDERSSQKM